MTANSIKMDSLNKANLDEEFKKLLTRLRPYIINLSNPKYITFCRVWMEKLSLCTSDESSIRNEYLSELFRQIQSNKIEEPFLSLPPDGPLQEINRPGSSNSWSDISSTSTRGTIDVPVSGDSMMVETEEVKDSEIETFYEKKIEEQQRIIDDLHQKNNILTKQLKSQIFTHNSQAEVGMNMMASEVEYLKERLRELILMKKNLQSSHNTIILQWENVTRELEFELRTEKQKNNELQKKIQELENDINNPIQLGDKIIREDYEKKMMAEHAVEICAINEQQELMIKNLEEKSLAALKQREDEYITMMGDLKDEYEQRLDDLKTLTDKNIKDRDIEIERLLKIVEDNYERMQQEVIFIRSQMDQETLLNNDALLEKVNFLQSCILKMDKLLRKYEKHYSKKVSVLTNELFVKENSMQIQLTTQRAQLMAKASSERQSEIEEIVVQLERRYRQLLEDQQFQVNEIRQDYTNIIKQLSDKFEIKVNTL